MVTEKIYALATKRSTTPKQKVCEVSALLLTQHNAWQVRGSWGCTRKQHTTVGVGHLHCIGTFSVYTQTLY
jgi:hypothetical protein